MFLRLVGKPAVVEKDLHIKWFYGKIIYISKNSRTIKSFVLKVKFLRNLEFFLFTAKSSVSKNRELATN